MDKKMVGINKWNDDWSAVVRLKNRKGGDSFALAKSCLTLVVKSLCSKCVSVPVPLSLPSGALFFSFFSLFLFSFYKAPFLIFSSCVQQWWWWCVPLAFLSLGETLCLAAVSFNSARDIHTLVSLKQEGDTRPSFLFLHKTQEYLLLLPLCVYSNWIDWGLFLLFIIIIPTEREAAAAVVITALCIICVEHTQHLPRSYAAVADTWRTVGALSLVSLPPAATLIRRYVRECVRACFVCRCCCYLMG